MQSISERPAGMMNQQPSSQFSLLLQGEIHRNCARDRHQEDAGEGPKARGGDQVGMHVPANLTAPQQWSEQKSDVQHDDEAL
jgi:hypothetical protein